MFWSAENNIFSKFGVKNIRVTKSRYTFVCLLFCFVVINLKLWSIPCRTIKMQKHFVGWLGQTDKNNPVNCFCSFGNENREFLKQIYDLRTRRLIFGRDAQSSSVTGFCGLFFLLYIDKFRAFWLFPKMLFCLPCYADFWWLLRNLLRRCMQFTFPIYTQQVL